MMAEALVPHRLSPDHITGAYSVSDGAAEVLTQAAPTLAVEVNPYSFFRGGAS